MSLIVAKILEKFLLRFIPIALIVCLNTAVFPQAGKAGAFLRLGVGARAKAMGSAFTGLAQGVEASYYNPAGLPFLKSKQLQLSYRALSLNRQFNYIGFGMPIRPKVASGSEEKTLNGGFALSWIRAGVNDIDGRNSDGQHSQTFSNSENAFSFAFGLHPTHKLAVGLAVKVILNRFPELGIDGKTVSANGLGLDFGLLYFAADGLTFGITFKDINAKYRWNSQDLFDEEGSETIDNFPKIARYGIALNVPGIENLLFLFDYEQLYKESLFKNKIDDRFHLGVQYGVRENITLLGGFDDGSITAGAGYQFPVFGKSAQIYYAYVTPGNKPEEEHIFTWSIEF